MNQRLRSSRGNESPFSAVTRIKSFVSSSITIALALHACAFKSSAAEAGLVAHWRFDKMSGQEVHDSSTNHNDGRLLGSRFVEGKFSGGAWVNRVADEKWNMIVSREIKDGPSEYFGLAVFQNKALFSIDRDGAHYVNVRSTNDVPSGQWIHLAGTYDLHGLKLFMNGKLVNAKAYSGVFDFADQNPIIIGGNTNTKGQKWVDCFNGRIDEVHLYNRVLDEAEIAAIYREGEVHK